MPTPKKPLSNSDVINFDKSETLPIPTDTTLKEKEASRKDNQIVSVHKKELPKNTQNNNSNNNKKLSC